MTVPDDALNTSAGDFLALPLPRILGTRSANALAKLGVNTVSELLVHAPFRLSKRGELMPIKAINEGDTVTVVARVLASDIRPMHSRRGYILNVRIADGMHELSLAFFAKQQRIANFHKMKLTVGTIATFSGTISSYRGDLQLTHPEYEVLADESELDPQAIARPIPIYHATKNVPTWHIARAINTLLPLLNEQNVPDLLPAIYRQEHNLLSRVAALRALHQPADIAQWELARLTLKHEEAFILQTLLAQRVTSCAGQLAPACELQPHGILSAFDSQLPFVLTGQQIQVGKEISADISQTRPMRRLLQGDVGTGKTIVALRAMLQVIDAQKQAVFIAPTEVLAAQHYSSIMKMFAPLQKATEPVPNVVLLTGSLSAKEKKKALLDIASGKAQLIIGTHALLQDRVQLPFLGMVVIDEQHRFGVDQRDKLAAGAHLLVMTGTPIPRTVAMTAFGDLQISTISELPQGRAEIATTLVPANNKKWMTRLWQRIAEETERGGQVYVVCPRIAQTDTPNLDELPTTTDLTAVESLQQTMQTISVLQNISMGVLHGQLNAEEKAKTMADFVAGKIKVLIATTIIEVGVDVPQATMMVIFDADNFGLSQLHQLRGRIGRGTQKSLCLAVYTCAEETLAFTRLSAFAQTTDGFILAQKDVELRSEGDILGTKQSGRNNSFQFLSVIADENIIVTAKQGALALIVTDPQLHSAKALMQVVEKLEADLTTTYLEKS